MLSAVASRPWVPLAAGAGRLVVEAVEVLSFLLVGSLLMFASSVPFAPAVFSVLASLLLSFAGRTPIAVHVRCDCSCICTADKDTADSRLVLLQQQAFGLLALGGVLVKGDLDL